MAPLIKQVDVATAGSFGAFTNAAVRHEDGPHPREPSREGLRMGADFAISIGARARPVDKP